LASAGKVPAIPKVYGLAILRRGAERKTQGFQ
jgi:hypothetical protein